jgi:hypothetical protein
VVAIDGTKLSANASRDATVDYDRIAREIVEDARATDAAEDEQFGDARGDELPRSWPPARVGAGGCARPSAASTTSAPRRHGRCRGPRPARVKEAKRRLEEELWTECQANRAYEAYRARGRMKDGRRCGRPPDPYQPPATPAGKINLTDPDCRLVKGVRGHLQGYNAQAATTEDQIVIAAEVTVDTGDFGHLEPMVTATRRSRRRPGRSPGSR